MSIITAMRWSLMSMFSAYRISSCALALLASTTVLAASQANPSIERVETGLLPIAAEKIGVLASITDRMRAYGVPGVSIAVIDHGEIVWAKGYGVADRTTGRPVTPQTLFQAASISKPVSALGALLLVQRGHVNLDEDVNRVLKRWRVPESDLTRGHPVTLRTLLNHTAGLAQIDPIRVVSEPGKTFEYSAAGYTLLQQLVTDISGKPFEQYMQSEVLQPIGMTSSAFAQTLSPKLLAIAATGHYAGARPAPRSLHLGPELAVAGLWTTPTDIARYVLSVQRSYGSTGELLRTELTREMLRPGLGNRGLGPAISGTGQAARFGHDGFNEGFECSFTAYIHEGRGAVVMANSGFAFMLIKEILESISRVYDWADYGPTTQQPPAAAIHQQLVLPVPVGVLTASPGEYRLDDTLTFEVYARERRLFIELPDSGTAEIFATPGGRYFCPQLIFSPLGSPWLRFVNGGDGVTTKILADDDGSAELLRVD
jgi:CubicO group peptidase (beta-lactamase class C family)